MPATQSHAWFPNQYVVELACEHCKGVVRHEPWCITQNPNVMGAWEIVLDPTKITLHDKLILHALGVCWNASAKHQWTT